MAKTLILDVDGVVVNGRPSDGKPWHTDLEQDTGISRAFIEEKFFHPFWRDIVLGKVDMREVLTHALSTHESGCAVDDFIKYWFAQDSAIVESVVNVAKHYRSKGVAVYLATNQEPERKKYLWEKMGLSKSFDGIFASCDLGFAKPQKEYYKFVQEKLAVTNASDCVFFDDRPPYAEGAASCGWDAHLFTTVEAFETQLQKSFNM